MADAPFLRPGEALRDLQTLEAIEEQPDISQRDLAARLGIAVGLTNACLRKMARKGLIKIKRVNSRNISYHLTPAGFSAKARLSIEFTEATIGFYRHAKQTVNDALGLLQARGVTRVVILGANDLAEIVCICGPAYGIEVVAVADDMVTGGGAEPEPTDNHQPVIVGHTTIPLEAIPHEGFDALVVADSETYQDDAAAVQKLARGRLIVWPLEGRIEPAEEKIK